MKSTTYTSSTMKSTSDSIKSRTDMRTSTIRKVFTKEQLQCALGSDERCIIAYGDAAKILKGSKKKKSALKIGGALLALGGLVAAPFTAGSSLLIGTAAAGLTVGNLTISAGELAVMVEYAIAIKLIRHDYDFTYNDDGSVTLNRLM